jgi:hypothetical protein
MAKGDFYYATVTGPHADIGFQQVDDFRPPVWPTGAVLSTWDVVEIDGNLDA